MPGKNTELVGAAIAALNDRDVERYVSLCTEGIELVTPITGLEGSHVGTDGVRRFFAELAEGAQSFRIDPRSCEEVSEGDLAAGKLRRVRAFLDHSEAVAAAEAPE